MSATEYTIDLRDIRFVLFEQLAVQESLKGVARYESMDQDTYESMLQAAADVSTQFLATCNRAGDNVGCKLDADGNITTPPGFKEAYAEVARQGLLGTAMDAEYGGIGLPHAVDAAITEMLTGANTAFCIYTGLSRAAANLLKLDVIPEWLRQTIIPKLISGEWTGTMCLTEAGAGSDVGASRTRAVPQDDGTFLITGEKVFISGGDSDMASNVIHLVLARLPDAPAGTRGISIFAVPKFAFDAEGNLGARNDAKVVGIEHKMGINGSATCTIAFGASGPCVGYLLGAPGQGMEIMFHMMNEARIGVGIQGIALASAAYQNAKSYAADRIQGSRVEDFRNADAKKVTIIEHPDVRRMLMTQKVYVETMRSLAYSSANRLDRAENGGDNKEYLLGLVELMTPIIKAHCSDLAFESTALALQTFGGYGYIKEYPVEQHVRDAKISSVYEGTNGIQAMDLLGRKMRKGNGMYFMAWLDECNQELEAAKALGVFGEEISALEKARDQLAQTAMHMGGLAMESLKSAMLQSYPFLTLFGTVVLGLHALWQARVAHAKLQAGVESEDDRRFYKGKILNAKFYTKNILPLATARAKIIQSNDTSCLDEELFV